MATCRASLDKSGRAGVQKIHLVQPLIDNDFDVPPSEFRCLTYVIYLCDMISICIKMCISMCIMHKVKTFIISLSLSASQSRSPCAAAVAPRGCAPSPRRGTAACSEPCSRRPTASKAWRKQRRCTRSASRTSTAALFRRKTHHITIYFL